jgi:predicted DNA-binding transcriptional regulator AlpA
MRRHTLSLTHYRTTKVCALVGLDRNTLRRMVKDGLFPPPIAPMNPRAGPTSSKLYLKKEVEQWLSMMRR